ncbi:desulfatase [Mucilaginibacter sp. PPCGB 2223]|uniref:phosphotransferase enzyme family protein n=1 Tax=Mucilaginibacter sp. PPCGB 2223 TaxID=1886027 RepID=UPI00082640A4|nr:aminoglycoside phosphotransferase family protein [Mucilaginibacter sp. PPCGB 2223]OCX51566.1 desulfatase [Mucilaginibacter sp. PPCGB 2223]
MENKEVAAGVKQVIAQFLIEGSIGAIKPFGSGHINDTYKISNADKNAPDYLLQRINHHIFKNVPGLIDNILYVTNHIKKKLAQVPGSDGDKQVLTLIGTKDGLFYHQDESGNYWRMYRFMNGTKSYDVVTNEKQAREGGRAFGNFQTMVADVEVSKLTEIIPDFHNIVFRLRQLDEAIKADAANRVKDVTSEIIFVNERAHDMAEIHRMGQAGKLPLRVTHNDTKFNNVLLDENDVAQCVIDLDTIMPGYTAFDFGDAVRTIINSAPEDEADLEKIQLNIPLFRAFAEGFLSQTINYMGVTEIRSLVKGVLLLPYIMGVRFLTDYLNGDVYYKIKSAGHNLKRARAQFQLVKKLEEHYTEIYAIVLQTVNENKELNEIDIKID